MYLISIESLWIKASVCYMGNDPSIRLIDRNNMSKAISTLSSHVPAVIRSADRISIATPVTGRGLINASTKNTRVLHLPVHDEVPPTHQL